MLRRQGVDFLAAFAPGVPRNMVRGRIKQSVGRMSNGSRVLGSDIFLCIGCSHRCAIHTTTLNTDAFVGLRKLGEIHVCF